MFSAVRNCGVKWGPTVVCAPVEWLRKTSTKSPEWNGWMDGWVDGWTDGRVGVRMVARKLV